MQGRGGHEYAKVRGGKVTSVIWWKTFELLPWASLPTPLRRSSLFRDPGALVGVPSGVAGNTVDQDGVKPCKGKSFDVTNQLESEGQKGNLG